MSRTIVTNSGSVFLTNVSSERLIGAICKEVGGKYYEDVGDYGPVMAYEMTGEEVKEVTGEDIRKMMGNLITKAEAITKQREDRIMDGNNILNQINLN